MLSVQTKSAELEADLHLVKTLVPLKSMMESHLIALLQDIPVDMVFAGQVLFEEGSYDHQLIYLLHGDLELRDNNGGVSIKKGRSSLYPIACRQPRPCSAIALTDCNILRLDHDKVDKMLTWSQIAEYLLVDISYQRDLDEDADWMMTVLKSNLFFKVPPINVQQIFSLLKPVVVDAGDVILRQGEIGGECYFIKEGDAKVTQSSSRSSKPKIVAQISVGRCFGEDALLNETVRNATVTMSSNGVLMRLEKSGLILLLKEPQVDTLNHHQLIEFFDRQQDEEFDNNTVCIDVRTEEEYALGHIKKAVNIPLNLLCIKIRLLNKDTKYIVCCNTGRRSSAAVHLLNQQGFHTQALQEGLEGIPSDTWEKLEDKDQNFMLRNGLVIKGQ